MNQEIIRNKVGVHGYQVMTYSIGKSDKVLLMVHGGPGCQSRYLMDSHQGFADLGYRVVTWDQLGCGESDRPDDDSYWNLSRFIEEVEIVRKALGIENVILLGQSWGGVLGLEYCLHYIKNVLGFIAADTAFDLPHMQREFERKKLALGEETCTMMARREAEGSTEHPEYKAAVTLLMHRHMCRNEIWPEAFKYSLDNIAKEPFDAMFGPYFFNCTGNIRDFNRMDQLHKITIPTLLIHGEHDYILPDIVSRARDLLPKGELALLRNCSHTPFYESPEEYRRVVLDFLNKNF